MNDLEYTLSSEQLAVYHTEKVNLDDIVTPDEQAATLDVLQQNTPAPFRYPSDAYFSARNSLMAAYEELYSDFIGYNDRWDDDNMFVQHGDKLYYYKGNIVKDLEYDAQGVAQDASSPNITALVAKVAVDFGSDLIGPVTIADVDTIIQATPPGMPTLLDSNDDFYEFENVFGDIITPSMMTRELLDQIQATFTGDYGPFYSPVDNSLVLKDGQLYLINLTLWYHKPSKPALGVYFDGNRTNECFFFPYAPLSAEDKESLYEFCSFEMGKVKPLRIVDL